jgi:hypothetical protein
MEVALGDDFYVAFVIPSYMVFISVENEIRPKIYNG